ncbi:MAG TPA: hypothetical protein VGG95_08785 [Edaphobacter sp.]
MCKIGQVAIRGIYTQDLCGPLYGRMKFVCGDLVCTLKTVPSMEQRVTEASVHQPRLNNRRQFSEEFFKTNQIAPTEPSAGISRIGGLQQHFCFAVGSISSDGSTTEDGNPHLEFLGLFHQHMFLRRKQPEQIAAAYLVSEVPQQVDSSSLRNQVQFQFGMMMRPIGDGKVCVTPNLAIENGRKLETLQHDKE